VLCCVGGRAVHDGHGDIGLRAVPIAIDFGHCAGNCCSLQTSGRRVVASDVLERRTSKKRVCFVEQFGR
jgi:hypothetical protein